MRIRTLAAAGLCAALAACGDRREETPAPKPAAPAPAETAKPAAPAPADAPAAPAARTTVDARGVDWSHHMGDIPFRLDTAAAIAQAKAEKRPLLLYFTQEH